MVENLRDAGIKLHGLFAHLAGVDVVGLKSTNCITKQTIGIDNDRKVGKFHLYGADP